MKVNYIDGCNALHPSYLFGDIMTANRKCNYCGSSYYICRSCIKAGNAWKNVCCSKECFIQLSKIYSNVRPIVVKESGMKQVLLRGVLKNGMTVDVIGYDLDLGRFDCTDGKTYVYDDFKIVSMSAVNFEDMIKSFKTNIENRNKAIEKDAKKMNTKVGSVEKAKEDV